MSGTAPTDRYTPVPDATGRTIYHDESRGTYHAWCDDGDYDPVSTAIVAAVATIRNAEPETLEPLVESVDPDALNALVGHWVGQGRSAGAASVRFDYASCAITVRADGEVIVEPDPGAGDQLVE